MSERGGKNNQNILNNNLFLKINILCQATIYNGCYDSNLNIIDDTIPEQIEKRYSLWLYLLTEN